MSVSGAFKMPRLTQEIYDKNAVELAPYLLGQYLCRRTEQGILRYRITETEAYYTEKDTACHIVAEHPGQSFYTTVAAVATCTFAMASIP